MKEKPYRLKPPRAIGKGASKGAIRIMNLAMFLEGLLVRVDHSTDFASHAAFAVNLPMGFNDASNLGRKLANGTLELAFLVYFSVFRQVGLSLKAPTALITEKLV